MKTSLAVTRGVGQESVPSPKLSELGLGTHGSHRRGSLSTHYSASSFFGTMADFHQLLQDLV